MNLTSRINKITFVSRSDIYLFVFLPLSYSGQARTDQLPYKIRVCRQNIKGQPKTTLVYTYRVSCINKVFFKKDCNQQKHCLASDVQATIHSVKSSYKQALPDLSSQILLADFLYGDNLQITNRMTGASEMSPDRSGSIFLRRLDDCASMATKSLSQ